MATQTVILSSHPGERGSRFELWSTNPVAMVQSVAADEPFWMSGIYKADFIDAPEAIYVLQHIDAAGKPLWTSFVALTVNTATFIAHEAAMASGGGGGLDAAGVRNAIGLASANLDAQLTALPTATRDSLLTAWATGTQVFGHSYLESIKRIEMASGAATLSGAGSGTEVMTSADLSKTATFTVDDDGNVSAVVWT